MVDEIDKSPDSNEKLQWDQFQGSRHLSRHSKDINIGRHGDKALLALLRLEAYLNKTRNSSQAEAEINNHKTKSKDHPGDL